MPRRLQHSPLLVTIVAVIFSSAVLIGILTAGISLYFASQHEVAFVKQLLDGVERGYVGNIAGSIWHYNEKDLHRQLDDLFQSPAITYVRLTRLEDKAVFTRGAPPAKGSEYLERLYPISLASDEKHRPLGELYCVADLGPIHTNLLLQYGNTCLTQFLGLIFFCCITLLLFLFLLNRHLNRIVFYTNGLTIDNLDQPLLLAPRKKLFDQPDELDHIVNAINAMRGRIAEGIAGRNKAEELLQRQIHFTNTLVNSLPGIFFVLNVRLDFLRANAEFDQRFFPRTGGNRGSFLDLIPPDLRESLAAEIQGDFSENHGFSLETELLSADREAIPYLLTGTMLDQEGERFLIVIGHDLGRRRAMEEKLRLGQKMEAIGTLAGGIAHDFNSILTVIFAHNGLAKLLAQNEPAILEHLEQTHVAAIRGRDLVKQILTFSRNEGDDKHPLVIAPVVKEAMKLLRSSIPSTVRIDMDIASTLSVLADPVRVHRIVMNLCTNAFQAMRDGGRLRVELKDVVLETAGPGPGNGLAAGDYVRLRVSDSGLGMDEATRRKIFEPYFTTRQKEAGTGLGLAVVHGIVRNMGGSIAVSSTPGQGTTFEVLLPAVRGAQESRSSTAADAGPMGGGEHLMIVDDESHLADIQAAVLRRAGYQVSTFSLGRAALDAFREQPESYALVLTDMTMPNMTGMELGRRMLEIRSDIPIILCSGFHAQVNRERVLEAGFVDYYEKPLDIEELQRKLRGILDRERTRMLY